MLIVCAPVAVGALCGPCRCVRVGRVGDIVPPRACEEALRSMFLYFLCLYIVARLSFLYV